MGGGAPEPVKESVAAKRTRLQREVDQFKREAVSYRQRGMRNEALVALRKFKVIKVFSLLDRATGWLMMWKKSNLSHFHNRLRTTIIP